MSQNFQDRASHIAIEPATMEDLDAIIEIENHSYACPWTPSLLQAEIHGKDFSYVYVARLTSSSENVQKIIGYSYFWLVAEEVHILNVAVDPDYRRHGFGAQLVEFALDFGRKRGAHRAFLEVRASNAIGRKLYERLGFTRIGLRKRYYSDNKEDAYVLQKALQ